MLSDLENHSSQLRLLSYGVSLTTLEEVFMKVGADSSGDVPSSDSDTSNGTNGNGIHNDTDVEHNETYHKG